MHLYWMETATHQNDWFVVAKSSQQAKAFYSNEEGCTYNQATARRVAKIKGSDLVAS